MVKKIDFDNRVLALTKRIGLRMALFPPFQGGSLKTMHLNRTVLINNGTIAEFELIY